jgi:glycosyltransferase involved in cell wall biosynthesis
LRRFGINLQELPALFGSFPPRHKPARLLWGPLSAAERSISALRSHFYDVTLLQRELISTILTLEPLCRHPIVFDVDDAIWVHRGGSAARRIASLSDRIVCGNSFLAEWFAQWCKDVRIVPTAVDTNRFRPLPAQPGRQHGLPALGWSGTASGLPQLYDIEDSLATVLRLNPDWMLIVMSSEVPRFRKIPGHRVIFHEWSAERELDVFQSMSIGLMPLRDDEWSRGKCSYKMLIYMACGLPVVVSAVGMNVDVLGRGDCGIGVAKGADWIDALNTLMRDQNARRLAGEVGRRIVENHFSLTALTPQLAAVLTGW